MSILLKSIRVGCFLIIISLTACMTPDPTQTSFIAGRHNFAEQNYGLAFKQLYPAAMQNYPEAQYAIGFMYYYGYGTNKDIEQARDLIDKAAAQGYTPAIRAKAMLDTPVWSPAAS